VGRGDVDSKLFDQPGQAWRLAPGQVEDQPCQRRRVDDGVLERALQAAADEPGVERVVAVLDEHGGPRESKEGAPGVLELGRADEHRALDPVPAPRVRVDRRPAVDERVEEAQRAVEREALRADLQDQERRVPGRLHVQGDELRGVERRAAPHLRRVDGYLLPWHRLGGATRLEEDARVLHRAAASARRAHAISSPSRARSRTTPAPYTITPTAIGMATCQPPRSRSG
jgi:hypothetical protein